MLTAADIFKQMPQQFDASKAKNANFSIQFDLSGDNGGQWFVKIADGQCDTGEGSIDNPKATIRMDATDYVKMTSGELNPMAAFMSGKVKVEGDLSAVMQLQSLFGM
ncbi:MAG: SCP2 sterol-binding domain-containing protein [Ardenticatenaceae bacterium]|nr:SCP2 sterol-binding domain-containing protein [Ardenticatenaceae bacterium]